MTIKMIDKWVTSFRFNEIKNKNKCLYWFLIYFIFCRLAVIAVSGTPSVTWLSRKWRQWGVSAVAILDCSLTVVCGQSRLVRPTRQIRQREAPALLTVVHGQSRLVRLTCQIWQREPPALLTVVGKVGSSAWLARSDKESLTLSWLSWVK